MKTYKKHSISLIFLAIFLLTRVVSLHAMSHASDDKEVSHCEECVLIVNAKKGITFDFTPNTEFKISRPLVPKTNSGFTEYKTPSQKTLLSDYFHNKPPPNILQG